ncbi:hypothetical protein [Streptomyces sp. x-80]|uniref:hypothetical protein n=1 Tax=Streptomyces sp. x-80 TaxID=2789282 RepID=UPI0039804BCF
MTATQPSAQTEAVRALLAEATADYTDAQARRQAQDHRDDADLLVCDDTDEDGGAPVNATLDAAARLGRALGHLPGALIEVSNIYPDHIEVSVHDGLARFEQWREALDIPSTDIDYRDIGASRMRLQGRGAFAGVDVKLTGHAPAITTCRVAP